MPSLLSSLVERRSTFSSLGMEEWIEMFNFGGTNYPFVPAMTMAGGREEKIGPGFLSYIHGAYKTDGVVFACMAVRQRLFSEARFQFRRRSSGRAGELFGNSSLEILEKPWPNATTGDLLARMIQDVDLAGNFFGAQRSAAGGKTYLRRLRPDCVTIILGSKTGHEIDAEPVGYLYEPKVAMEGVEEHEPIALLPEEVVHWAPIPDPEARFRGMSWLTPVLREIMGDKAMSQHALKFFEHGATPNLVVKFDPLVDQEAFETWRNLIEEKHTGLAKAYKTLYLGGGADATVVGGNMKQVDFTNVRGNGETRIASAAGVPAVIAGLSEGLKAATYSNFQQAARITADVTMRPLWRGAAGALQTIVPVPAPTKKDGIAELWYDDRDIAFLKEDAKDAVENQQKKATTIKTLTDSGFTPVSVILAVERDDWSLLEHSGMYSVQLWAPGQHDKQGEGTSTHEPGEDGESPRKP